MALPLNAHSPVSHRTVVCASAAGASSSSAHSNPNSTVCFTTSSFRMDVKVHGSHPSVIPSRGDGEESPAQERHTFAHALGIPRRAAPARDDRALHLVAFR